MGSTVKCDEGINGERDEAEQQTNKQQTKKRVSEMMFWFFEKNQHN